ncbi:MAG TPA: hypothetical protein VMV87_01320 [Burkholderiales bacterium]|nr:hypothetical protein [Burkholderiales bacterium]
MSARKQQQPIAASREIAVDLSAVIVCVTGDQPRVLAIRPQVDALDALPSGPLESRHHTLEAGLRSWVESQTRQSLGYVEQLYTFGDRNRMAVGSRRRVRMLSIGYLALVREARAESNSNTVWRNWYHYFPWEDWRRGKPPIFARIERQLRSWVADARTTGERRVREERVRANFGLGSLPWSDERVLRRYELLYEIGLVRESHRDRAPAWCSAEDVIGEGASMIADHRRVLATAIARLRGKIKYRPVVFELMPPTFTFLNLQQAVEALAGLRMHKSNFRRIVESQGLVEDTGEISAGAAGRPARLLRYRRDVLLERPAPGARLPIAPRRK